MDMQDVSLSTASSMDVQVVFPSTASSLNVNGVSLSSASSMDVQLCRVFPLFKCQNVGLSNTGMNKNAKAGTSPVPE
jgi:hypothetical protein